MLANVLLGVAIGVTISLFVAEFFARRDHRAWMKMCDRYEAIIKKLKEPS